MCGRKKRAGFVTCSECWRSLPAREQWAFTRAWHHFRQHRYGPQSVAAWDAFRLAREHLLRVLAGTHQQTDLGL